MIGLVTAYHIQFEIDVDHYHVQQSYSNSLYADN